MGKSLARKLLLYSLMGILISPPGFAARANRKKVNPKILQWITPPKVQIPLGTAFGTDGGQIPNRILNSGSGNSNSGNSGNGNSSGAGEGSGKGVELKFDENALKNQGDAGKQAREEVDPKKSVPNAIAGGGGSTKNTEVVIPPLWMPFCWVVPPNAPQDTINKGVKAMVDSYGKCGIALEPFVFRVNYIPPDPNQINSLVQQKCPLNAVFGVEGSAAQTISPYLETSDIMCGEPKPWENKVAGCSGLGNKAGGGGGFSKASGYGSAGTGGVPQVSIVDWDAKEAANVWCHESGHSVGGPGHGGDWLVNVGDGKRPPEPQQANLGLEAANGAHAFLRLPHEELEDALAFFFGPRYHASGSAGSSNECNWSNFGCLSLRGGANSNADGKHKWAPSNPVYYKEDPSTPPKWDLMGPGTFFDRPPIDPNPPIQPIVRKPPPKGKPDDAQLVFNDEFFDKTPPPANQPLPGGDERHKRKPTLQGADQLLDSIRKNLEKPTDDAARQAPDLPKQEPAGKEGGGLVFDENVKKANEDDGEKKGGGDLYANSSSSGSGSSNSTGGLFFDENAAKGASGSDGTGTSLRKGKDDKNPDADKAKGGLTSQGAVAVNPLDGLKKPDTSMDENFFALVKKPPQKRIKGSTLRKNIPVAAPSGPRGAIRTPSSTKEK